MMICRLRSIRIVQELTKDGTDVQVVQARIHVLVSDIADAETRAVGASNHLNLRLLVPSGVEPRSGAKVGKDVEQSTFGQWCHCRLVSATCCSRRRPPEPRSCQLEIRLWL